MALKVKLIIQCLFAQVALNLSTFIMYLFSMIFYCVVVFESFLAVFAFYLLVGAVDFAVMLSHASVSREFKLADLAYMTNLIILPT